MNSESEVRNLDLIFYVSTAPSVIWTKLPPQRSLGNFLLEFDVASLLPVIQ